MNEKALALVVTIILLASMFLVAIQVISACTLKVGPGKPCSTIQAAVDAAGSGDTIMVARARFTRGYRCLNFEREFVEKYCEVRKVLELDYINHRLGRSRG